VTPEQERERVIELIRRLRRLVDDLAHENMTMAARNSSVAMMDAADTLVDHVLDGLEP
jgi:hypothetical protein